MLQSGEKSFRRTINMLVKLPGTGHLLIDFLLEIYEMAKKCMLLPEDRPFVNNKMIEIMSRTFQHT